MRLVYSDYFYEIKKGIGNVKYNIINNLDKFISLSI